MNRINFRLSHLRQGIAMCALLAAPAVLADDVSGFTIVPGIGYMDFADERNLEGDVYPSLGLGYQFNNRFSTEAAYGIFSTESNATGKDIDGTYYHVDAVYHLNDDDTLQPYVLAGIGNMDLDIPDSENDAETSYNAGAGHVRDAMRLAREKGWDDGKKHS